jgi:hypothetical protein
MEKSQRMRERASKKGGKKDRAANIAEGSNGQVRGQGTEGWRRERVR